MPVVKVRGGILLAMLVSLNTAAWAHDGAPEKLGKVSFANSCRPDVQATLERGVALLHSFWFREGEKAFREAWAQDAECAIAGSGIASNLIGNTFAVGPNPAQAGNTEKARYYFARLVEMAGPGVRRSDMQGMRQ